MSGASVRSGIDPGSSSGKVDSTAQRSFPAGLLAQLPVKAQLKAAGGVSYPSGGARHIAPAPVGQLHNSAPLGLIPKLASVMGNTQLGGSGDPTGQPPSNPGGAGPTATLPGTQIINMPPVAASSASSQSSLSAAAVAAAAAAQSQTPIHPVSIPTPVGIHTSGGTLVQPQSLNQTVQMASLIRGGLQQAQQPQILHATYQTHVPRGPAQISQLSTPKQGSTTAVLRPSQPGSAPGGGGGAGLAIHPQIQPRVLRPSTPPVGAGRAGSPAVSLHAPTSAMHQQQQQDRSNVAPTTVQITIHQGRSDARQSLTSQQQATAAAVQQRHQSKIVMSHQQQQQQQQPIVHGGTPGQSATKLGKGLTLAHLKQTSAGTQRVVTTHAGTIAAIQNQAKAGKGTGYANLAHTLSRQQKIVVTQTSAHQSQLQQHHPHTQHNASAAAAAIIATSKTAGGINLNQQQTISRTQKVVIPQISMPGSAMAAALPKAVASLSTTPHYGHHHQQHHQSPHPVTTVTSTIGSIPIAKVTPQRQLPSQLHSSQSTSSIMPSLSSSSSSSDPHHLHQLPHTASSSASSSSLPPATLFPHRLATPSVVTTAASSSSSHPASHQAPLPTTLTADGVGCVVTGSRTGSTDSSRTIFSGLQPTMLAATSEAYQGFSPLFLPLQQAAAAQASSSVAAAAAAAARQQQQQAIALSMASTAPGGLAASIQAAASQSLQHQQQQASTARGQQPMMVTVDPTLALQAIQRGVATEAANKGHNVSNDTGSHTGLSSSSSHPPPQPNNKASPLPSILRKRTNEGVMVVKKNLLGTAFSEMSDPPVSHVSSISPKSGSILDPNREVSQSSTDTASSAESPRQSQPHTDHIKVKAEPPETLENGKFSCPGNPPLGFSALANSLQNNEASPRKKPRKQMFVPTADEVRDCTSTDEEIERFSMKVNLKRELEKVAEEVKKEDLEEYVDEEGHRWTKERKRPPISLTSHYTCHWKTRNNHYLRYTDVKPKEERRPTVNELANQKGVHQKASGWKLYHLAAQLEELMDLEGEVLSQLKTTQDTLAPKHVTKSSMEDDIGMVHELSQGNIQRCQLFLEQVTEARGQMLKVLQHKQRIMDIVNKHHSKRPVKKKER